MLMAFITKRFVVKIFFSAFGGVLLFLSVLSMYFGGDTVSFPVK